jgi:2-oxo-4-hydroxy-4-carboxy--5-ureidoimidazoline (OHCU) decarboxylase
VTLKTIGWATLALTVVFAVGWFVGASGRSEIEQARRAATERAMFEEARALVADGRVKLFTINFGDASKRFESAKAVVTRLQTTLRESGQAERAGRLEIVLAHLRDAQRLAASVDASAQAAAEQAVTALDAVAPRPGA